MRNEGAFATLLHGQTPFFRLPIALTGSHAAALHGADAVLLGVPWDVDTSSRRGGRLGPSAVRRVSALPDGARGAADVFRELHVLDAGNVVVPPLSVEAMRDAVQADVTEIERAGALPIVIGGDHTITLPVLRAVAAFHGPVAVVQIDAHHDGRQALEERLIAPGLLHQVGARGAGRTFDIGDVKVRGVRAIAAAIREAVGDRPCYLTFDLDAVDPFEAPGVGSPVPGGLTRWQALELVRGLAGVRLVGADVVGLAPGEDRADATSQLAAQLLLQTLALIAYG